MKTILLATILSGFTLQGAYAQNIDCRQPHEVGACPADNVRPVSIVGPVNDQIACAAYTHGTSIVSACADSDDLSRNVQFTVDGNYPMSCTSRQRMDGTVVITCHPKCVLMVDPANGRQWYKCPED